VLIVFQLYVSRSFFYPAIVVKRISAVSNIKAACFSMNYMRSMLFAVTTLIAFGVHAQGTPSSDLVYDKEIEKSRSFVPLENNLFGDQVNLQDGVVSFVQTDVKVRTNFGQDLELGRVSASNDTAPGFGLGWGMNVPYMVGTYDSRDGWTVSGAGTQRCSAGSYAPNENYLIKGQALSTYRLPAHAFWHGVKINIPSLGAETLLKKNSSQIMPVDGITYYGTTKSGWRIGCIPALKNGLGEGFTVRTPDGMTYYFDWIAELADAPNYVEGGLTNYYTLPLSNYYIYATKAVDRFGNVRTYTYDTARPHELSSIISNDGARIDVTYSNDVISRITTGGREWNYQYESVETDAGSGVYLSALRTLVLPDFSTWKFEDTLNNVLSYAMAYSSDGWLFPPGLGFYLYLDCNQAIRDGSLTAPSLGVTAEYDRKVIMTHPSGAKGEFTFRGKSHGINKAPGVCESWADGPHITGVPTKYVAKSLTQKKITGPALAEVTWSYTYYPSWSFASQCSPSPQLCSDHSRTTVESSDGVVERYSFGSDYSINQGQLLSESIEKGGVVSQLKQFTYVTSASGQPFPDNSGDISRGSGIADLYGNPFLFKNRPLSVSSIQQDGSSFFSQANTYDAFSRPTKRTRWSELSSPGSVTHSKIDLIEYYDSPVLWVMGQVSKTTDQGTGLVESSTAFDSTFALPWKVYSFGKLLKTYIYDSNSAVASGQLGTLKTVTDGNSNVTTLTSWKRGIPQSIRYPVTPESPTGATQSAAVDDNGWVSSVFDENGYKTCYEYDSMGRLSKVTFPSNAKISPEICGANWNAINIQFAPTAEKFGIPTGHWAQFITQGDYRKITHFDSMWRPVVVEEYDAKDTPTMDGTRRIAVTRYDENGRTIFQSYSLDSLVNYADVSLKGKKTFYDVLDRPISVSLNSELTTTSNLSGLLTTTIEYLSGFKTRITNPKLQQLTASYKVYDQPTPDWPIAIDHAGVANTDITRDAFGKPLAVKRRSPGGTLSVTRSYAYDAYQQLCLSVEPETGATVQDFDAANNLSWSASGQPFTAATACAAARTGAINKVNRTYDARNRIKTLSFPDGVGNQTWTYTPDGLPEQVMTYNGAGNTNPVANAYHYNKLRLLDGTGETITWPGFYSWGIGHGYDGNGNETNQVYPTGLIVSFAPNALGQATQAGSYATSASYYPNGALKQFTYGNGIVHTMTQNARQLPSRSTDCTLAGTCAVANRRLDLGYAYDENANVSAVTDYTTAARQSRTATYDALDRLTQATSPMFGTATYTYDQLDNLKSLTVTAGGNSRSYGYVYDPATNQLGNITNGVGGSTIVGLGYDAQGNLNNKSGQLYRFDYGNRLREATNIAGYAYDANGRRVLASNLSWFQIFQYSQSGQLLYTTDDRSAKRTEHIYLAGSLVAQSEIPYGLTTATVKYQHTDALGTSIAVTDASKAVIQTSEYEPYGQLVNRALTDGPGFTGHVQDATTGLTYMQQRYYDPGIGRFLSVDPVTADSTTGANFNRYWYGNNNPYKFIDPDGRFGHRTDIPWWDIPSKIGNWFPKLIDLSADAAFGSYAAGEDALPDHYREAGEFILTVQSFALPEIGMGASLGAKARVGIAAARDLVAAKVITAGEIRLSKTAANSVASRPYVTEWSVRTTIQAGKRTTDPQGAAGRFMYTVEAKLNKTKGKFEVLVNEETNTVEHAVFKGGR
jgi:RHS repeat-associated protein